MESSNHEENKSWESIDPNIKKVFDELGLTRYFPGKITIQIARNNSRKKASVPSDIPWLFLDKVFQLDFNGKGDYFQIEKAEETDPLQGFEKFDWIDAYLDDEVTFSFHDIKNAVFLCCDDACKKSIAEKLHLCHLSVPFILPNLFEKNQFILQSWALRGMMEKIGYHKHIPIVSFMTVNTRTTSKTKIINNLLSDNKSFDTFFDIQDEQIAMSGRNVERVVSNGIIDSASFEPPECTCQMKPCQCTFKELLLMLNLCGYHGNYNTIDLIGQISDAVIIFLDLSQADNTSINDIKRVMTISKKVSIVYTKGKSARIQECKRQLKGLHTAIKGIDFQHTIHFLFNHTNGAEFTIKEQRRRLYKLINSLLDNDGTEKIRLKDHIENLEISNISTDCKKNELGRQKAKEIYRELKEVYENVHDILTPLQGDKLWVAWSDLERNLQVQESPDHETPSEFKERLMKDQKNIRGQQVMAYKNASNKTTELFCKSLVGLKDQPRANFLEWLIQFLKKYDADRDEHNAEHAECDNRKFGLTNLFREVGQIFEAFDAFKIHGNVIMSQEFSQEHLCKVIADLFIQGLPLNIVDCKTMQIPLTFIESVFNYVKGSNPDKVFVLSVLGIQSSGKSTLLNALFGTNFSTDVGLCTEGVNAQLFPLPSDYQTGDYKHILLIDTKGLRASDNINSTSYKQDNELATLLFAISNLTIVNIKGENRSDVDNILQIVTHALLKIKSAQSEIKVKTKCLFIHHNVDDQHAKAKLTPDNMVSKEKLDKITLGVAERFGLDEVKNFSDIIDYNMDDVIYFPNLWQGTPPMASINPGYSDKVRFVKNLILDKLMPTNEQPKLDISMFSTQLRTVWDAIQSEDFVFRFRNLIAINAHTKVEGMIREMRWELNKMTREKLPELIRWVSSQLDTDVNMIFQHMEKVMEEKYEEVISKLDNFFQNDENRDLLKDWRNDYNDVILKLKHDKMAALKKIIFSEIEVGKVEKEQSKRIEEWKDDARKSASEFAKECLTTGIEINDKEKAEASFNDLWKKIHDKIPSPHFKVDVENVLRYGLRDAGKLPAVKVNSLDFTKQEDVDFQVKNHHLNYQGQSNRRQSIVHEIFMNVVNNMSIELDKFIEGIQNDIFSSIHVEQMVQIVQTIINNWNIAHPDAKLNEKFLEESLIHYARNILPYFKKMQEKLINKIDVRQKLKQFKGEIRTIFLNKLLKIDDDRTKNEIFCNKLKYSMKEMIDTHLKHTLVGDIRKNNQFLESKKTFMQKVQTNLVQNLDKFRPYMLYLNRTSKYLKDALTEYVNDYLFKDQTYFLQAERKIDELSAKIFKLIPEGTEQMMDENTNQWMETIEKLSTCFPELAADAKELGKEIGRNERALLTTYLIRRIKEILNELKSEYQKEVRLSSDFTDHVIKPIFEYVQGCPNRCHFCLVQCSAEIPGHKIECSSSSHYPICIKGYRDANKNKLLIETCNDLVATSRKLHIKDENLKVTFKRKFLHYITMGKIKYDEFTLKFNEFKKVYKEWDIEANPSLSCPLFIKRFISNYCEELATHHGASSMHVPDAWRDISKVDALEDIRSLHNKPEASPLLKMTSLSIHDDSVRKDERT